MSSDYLYFSTVFLDSVKKHDTFNIAQKIEPYVYGGTPALVRLVHLSKGHSITGVPREQW